MAALRALLWPLERWNDAALPVGRWLAVAMLAAMVAVTLLQIVMRYVFNAALPWPDEAARFCMLWMTGLIAPMAYRRGGFVAIDLLGEMLPARAAAALSLSLLAVSGVVLWVGVRIGWAEVTGFGGRFATSSLWLPLPDGWLRVPRSWMMASLLAGFALMVVVNLELVLRSLLRMCGARDLKPLGLAPGEIRAE